MYIRFQCEYLFIVYITPFSVNFMMINRDINVCCVLFCYKNSHLIDGNFNVMYIYILGL